MGARIFKEGGIEGETDWRGRGKGKGEETGKGRKRRIKRKSGRRQQNKPEETDLGEMGDKAEG